MTNQAFWPKVLQAIPLDGYKVCIYFNDGSVRLFDVEPLIEPNTVFEALADLEVFRNSLTILNETVAFDVDGKGDPRKSIDLDPFVLFEQPVISDPLVG